MSDGTWTHDCNPQVWLSSAGLQMIKQEPAIRKKLENEHHFSEFQAHMCNWKKTHLDGAPFEPEGTAVALYRICNEYGLVAIVGDPATPAPRVATTRGPSQPSAGLEGLLQEAAGTYTI